MRGWPCEGGRGRSTGWSNSGTCLPRGAHGVAPRPGPCTASLPPHSRVSDTTTAFRHTLPAAPLCSPVELKGVHLDRLHAVFLAAPGAHGRAQHGQLRGGDGGHGMVRPGSGLPPPPPPPPADAQPSQLKSGRPCSSAHDPPPQPPIHARHVVPAALPPHPNTCRIPAAALPAAHTPHLSPHTRTSTRTRGPTCWGATTRPATPPPPHTHAHKNARAHTHTHTGTLHTNGRTPSWAPSPCRGA